MEKRKRASEKILRGSYRRKYSEKVGSKTQVELDLTLSVEGGHIPCLNGKGGGEKGELDQPREKGLPERICVRKRDKSPKDIFTYGLRDSEVLLMEFLPLDKLIIRRI